MSQSIKRVVCCRCLRPQLTCICHWVTPVANAVDVLILQHPLETAHAKGSARLLHLSLLHSRLLVGEVFDEQQLQEVLFSPFGPDTQRKHAVLLYPETSDDACIAQAPSLDFESVRPDELRLVVLDGTWRKSRKMLYANPALQLLPRLALSDMPPSQYVIRKARGAHQLSTLEATCYALAQLEKNSAKYVCLLDAFKGFVEQQLLYQQGRGYSP